MKQKVAIARSSTALPSLANGAAQIHWSPWLTPEDAVAIFLNLYVVVLNNAKWRIRGQYSVDGTTGSNIGTDGYIDGLSAASAVTGGFSYQYAGTLFEFQGMVRIGIEITGSDGTSLGSAQVNCDITFVDEALPQTTRLASATSLTNVGSTDTQLGSNASSSPFKSARATLKLTAASADTLTLIIKTGKADALAKAATATLASGATEVSVELTTLGDVVAVFYNTGASWATRTGTCDLVLRPV